MKLKSVLVANPKGGSGKTTLATNLAGGLANLGEPVTLWDLDRQKSSLAWLDVRPPELPPIARLDGGGTANAGKGKGWLVLDSPAGLHGKNLQHALKLADRVLVPVQPSLFDMAAANDFLLGLVAERPKASRRTIGVVGMRVDARTKAAATLEAFLSQMGLPVLTYLRDAQLYANAAFGGKSVFDLPEYMASRELVQWQPVLDWLLGDGWSPTRVVY
ncbi:MAG: AAA family ATPase [Betaproteobacteria bacterium]|jgi:chromosome partitioning protein